MKTYLHVLAVVISFASSSAFADTISNTAPLRVLTYNIHHGGGSDERIDLPRIANVILQTKPDLVALQEVDRNTRRSGGVDQLAILAELTGMNASFGKAIDFDGGEYGVAVLSRFKINRAETSALPSTSGHEARVALAVHVDVPHLDAFTFVCTHLDHTRDSAERLRQVAKLNDLFASIPGTVVLAGDLNTTPEQSEFHVLRQKWLHASLISPAPTIPAHVPTRQIDFVMLRKSEPWRVLETRVIDERIASDHAPVLAVLEHCPAATPDLPRNELLFFRDVSGNSQPVTNIGDWWERRASIMKAMESIMGSLPGNDKRCELDIRVEEDVDCGTYVRRLITYASEPGSRVPAYLLIPKHLIDGHELAPAVLCLHPTDNELGHKVVVGLGGKANRQYAQELAERGYVTLAPAYPLLANYQPDLKKLGYVSGTMKAIWDNMRGIDLLESLPFVAPKRIGVIGHSLGGHNGLYTAVFDTRIKVIVSSCGLDSYVDYMDGDIRGWTSTRYMPGLLDYAHRLSQVPFDFHEIVGAMAPRNCFISAPLHDENFRWQSVDAIAASATPVFSLYGFRDRLHVEHPNGAHDFPDDVREKAYELFDQVLGKEAVLVAD